MKAATRSEKGCMTCKIRRKKCVPQPGNDSCQTCTRLRLQCMRSGDRHPSPAETEKIRDRIKTFLTSQGMIKGHMGTPFHTPLSDRSSDPPDASPLPPLHSIMTTAPQPSSPPLSDIPGGAAGGAGASYGGQSFLSFADIIGTSASSHNEAQYSASSRKGENRQAKHAPVGSAVEESSDDGFGEDESSEDEPGPDEGASSFSRHPPGYPQPNYDLPQHRPRYPYEMGSPPQQPPNGNLPRPPYEPNVGYPAFPGHHFLYGPGIGAASGGPALAGYTQFGHAGYRGPSPSDNLNSSFASGPPPPKTDPFYSGPRLAMMDARHGTAALPGPPLSMSIGRSGRTSPTYNQSGYRSPNPPPGRSPMGAGMTSSRDNISHRSGETAEEAADIELIPNPHQLSAGTSASTQVDITTAYTSNPYIPGGSSFGSSYTFDKTL